MLQFNRNPSSTHDVRIKIVGLGGAGGNVLDRLLLDGTDDTELVAINTDGQALTASVVTERVQLGRMTTRGLAAGGDPDGGDATRGYDHARTGRGRRSGSRVCRGGGGDRRDSQVDRRGADGFPVRRPRRW